MCRGCFYVPEEGYAWLLRGLFWVGSDDWLCAGVLVFVWNGRYGTDFFGTFSYETEIVPEKKFL